MLTYTHTTYRGLLDVYRCAHITHVHTCTYIYTHVLTHMYTYVHTCTHMPLVYRFMRNVHRRLMMRTVVPTYNAVLIYTGLLHMCGCASRLIIDITWASTARPILFIDIHYVNDLP